MIYGGTVSKEGRYIKDTLKMEAWMDRCLSAHAIKYDGELTDEICDHIVHSYNAWQNENFKVSRGGLRIPQKPVAKYVDVEKRVLVVEHSDMLVD